VSRFRAVSVVGLTVAIAATVSACGTATPMPTPTPSPTYAVTGDGVLRIGTLVDTSGVYAAGQVAGVETAVREINEAGGVNGAPVELLHRNSGTTSEAVVAAYEGLVARGVDVVIGPQSSVLVDSLAEAVVTAGVPLISPSASLADLGDSGLVFRTIGDYRSQGDVLAQLLAEEKVTSVAYLSVADDGGEALLGSLTAATEDAGITLGYNGTYTASTASFTKIVNAVKNAKPAAIVIASGPDASTATAALITALSAAKLGGEKIWLTSQNLADYSQTVAAGLLENAHGLLEGSQPDAAFAARLRQADPSAPSLRYAQEAYDATILAALAATKAEDDGGPAIARLLPVVSADGIPCTSFGACIDVLRTEPDIDYTGVSGPVDVAASGDVGIASWGVYTYGAGNTPSLVRTILAG
jgi:branched-chain amino acid transport system substrate-binding protein